MSQQPEGTGEIVASIALQELHHRGVAAYADLDTVTRTMGELDLPDLETLHTLVWRDVDSYTSPSGDAKSPEAYEAIQAPLVFMTVTRKALLKRYEAEEYPQWVDRYVRDGHGTAESEIVMGAARRGAKQAADKRLRVLYDKHRTDTQNQETS